MSRRRRSHAADVDPAARTAVAAADGLDRVLVAPSLPLGIEALPVGEAEPLLDAFHAGVLALGGRSRCGLAPAGRPRAGARGRAAGRRRGRALPARRRAGVAAEGLAALGPALEALAPAPLFVHPGAAPPGPALSGGRP